MDSQLANDTKINRLFGVSVLHSETSLSKTDWSHIMRLLVYTLAELDRAERVGKSAGALDLTRPAAHKYIWDLHCQRLANHKIYHYYYRRKLLKTKDPFDLFDTWKNISIWHIMFQFQSSVAIWGTAVGVGVTINPNDWMWQVMLGTHCHCI